MLHIARSPDSSCHIHTSQSANNQKQKLLCCLCDKEIQEQFRESARKEEDILVCICRLQTNVQTHSGQSTYVWSHLLQHEQDPHFLLDVHVFRRLPWGLLAVHPPFSRGSVAAHKHKAHSKINGNVDILHTFTKSQLKLDHLLHKIICNGVKNRKFEKGFCIKLFDCIFYHLLKWSSGQSCDMKQMVPRHEIRRPLTKHIPLMT